MLKNPFTAFKKQEWILWILSLIVVAGSNLLSGTFDLITLCATLVGVTALIFLAGGNVWGQILTVVFSLLYAATSYTFCYYGEMITYLGMTMPIAAVSIVSWLRHPAEPGKNVVKIHRLTPREVLRMLILTAAVTAIFYWILQWLGTANLLVSTISITTSFLASYLTLMRNSYYALAYAANDIILIVLWVLASWENPGYIPMVACFLMFLINDFYGFIRWKHREKTQTPD